MCFGKASWAAVLFAFAMLWGREAVGDKQEKDSMDELKAMWKSQRTEIATARIRYRLFQWGASGLLPLGPDEVRRILTSRNLAANPDDLGILINKLRQQPDPSVTPWGIHDFYFDGTKSKDIMQGGRREVLMLTDKERVEYSPENSSVMIFAAGGSRRHMRSMREFREIPDPLPRYDIEEKQARLWVLRTGSARLVVDPATGLLHEGDYYVDRKITNQDIQGSFISYPGGIVFPSLSANAIYNSSGVLYAISLSWVEDAEFNQELPKDTFSLAIPGKTNVFDNRSPSDVRTFPYVGPIEDVVEMADTPRSPTTQISHHHIPWLIGNIILLILLIGVFFWRKRRLRDS